MGLLSTPAPLLDDKLIVGAYVRKGLLLFRVDSRTVSQVILEDVYRPGRTVPTTASDIVANYALVRTANPRAIA